MKITSSLQTTLVPKWNGNEKLPVNERLTVEIVNPTVDEYEAFLAENGGKFNGAAMIRKFTGKISGFEFNGKKVTTTDELLALPRAKVKGLIDEIADAIWWGRELKEEAAKNSASQPN